MAWLPVGLAALLLAALTYSFVRPHLTRGRRARHAHRGNVVHWYPNYDDDLFFEPRYEDDIVAVSRDDLSGLGYREGSEHVLVPRTFRHRVPGDRKMSLWTSTDPDLRSLWICRWHGVEIHTPNHSHPRTTPLKRADLARLAESRPMIVEDVPAQEHDPISDPAWKEIGSAEDATFPVDLGSETNRFGCSEIATPPSD